MRRDKFILPIVGVLLIGSFFIYDRSEAKVLISKIQIAGVSSTDEFVELYNFSSSSASLDKWSLKKQTSGGTANILVSSFPSSSILNPFSYYLIAHRDYQPIQNVTADLAYSNNSYSLASNNSLLLLDAAGLLIDRVDWGTVSTTSGQPTANPPASKSLVRLPDDNTGNFTDTDDSILDFTVLDSAPFNSLSPARPVLTISDNGSGGPPPVVADPLVSTTGTIDTSTSWSLIKINEIMPDPEVGSEWVELFNNSSSSLELSGGTLCDNRSSETCTVATPNGTIQPLGWLTIFLSSSHLNNDGDSVILKNPGGEIIDRVDYGNGQPLPAKGESYARAIDGSDTDSNTDWAVTENPTPDAANVIVTPPTPAPVFSGGGSAGSASTEAIKVAKTTASSTTKSTAVKDAVSIIWKIQLPAVAVAETSTAFDAHLSADPRGGEIFFSWNFGDGSVAEGSRVAHTFSAPGIYTVLISGTSTEGTVGLKKLLVKVAAEYDVPAGIFLNGLSPRPEAEDEEWVSVGSNASDTVDLGGWHLAVDNKDFTVPPNTLLKPGNTLRFFRSATHLVLNNAGGTVLLTSPLGEAVDLVAFSNCEPGQSYIFSDNNWEWLPKITTVAQKVLGEKIVAAKKTAGRIQVVSAAEARNLTSRNQVVLTGTVLSLPSQPGSNYFYLGDDSGGIQIYSYKKAFPSLQTGDKIRVYGEIGLSQGLARVKIKSPQWITHLASGTAPAAETKNISEVDDSDYGRLIALEGEITKIQTTYLYLDDGSGETVVSLPKSLDKKSLHVGDTLRVVGIVEEDKAGWRLLPRTNADFSETRVAATKTTPVTAPGPTPATYALFGTAGGLLLVGAAFLLRKKMLNKKLPVQG